MNEKAIELADLHFSVNQGNKEILEIQLSFFENLLFPYMAEHGITRIIQGGDFFDNRVANDTYVINQVKNRLFKAHPEIEWDIIVGNHDMYYKTNREYSIMHVLADAFDNIRLYDESTLIDVDGTTLQLEPWLLNDDRLVVDKKADAVFGHFEMKEFYMSKTYKSTHGIDPETLPKDIPILSAHYHNKQKKGNIFYLGTPFQLSWSDYNEEKGFYVYEGDWENLTFIENMEFKHLKVDFDVDTKEMVVNGFKDPLQLKYRKNMDLSMFKNNKIKVYAKKELAIIKTFIELLNDVAYKVDLEIIKETEELDTQTIIEKVKDYSIEDSIVAVVDDDDKGVLHEVLNEAKELMKE